MKGKISLVYDYKDKNGNLLPNGLAHKYHDIYYEQAISKQFNVLTRFIQNEENIRGWFPILLKESSFDVEEIHIDNLGFNDNYIYVIEPNHDDWSLVLENCFGNMSAKALELIKNEKVKFVFYYAYEAFPLHQCQFLSLIERSLGQLGLSPKQFHFIFGDCELYENLRHYYEKESPNPFYGFKIQYDKSFTFNHFEFEQRYWSSKQKKPEHKVKKDYYFLSLNGAGREHRQVFLSELDRLQLMHKGLVSYLDKFRINPNPEEWFIDNAQLLHWKKFKLTKKILDTDEDFNEDHNRYSDDSLYSKTCFSVVTETWPHGDSFFLTEKSFKPIANGHPFIIFGAPGSLKYLQKLGYQTFPDFFDETYDEKPQKERLKNIVNQIYKICQLDIKTVENNYRKVEDKIKFNQSLFYNKKITKEIDQLLDNILKKNYNL